MSGGSSKSSQKTTSTSYTPAQATWLEKALNVYGPTLGQGQQVYQGPRVAGFNPAQTALTDVSAYSDIFSAGREIPLFGTTGNTLTAAMTGQLGAQPLSTEQALNTFQQTNVNPAMEQFSRYTTPSIREEYAGPGFWNAARGQAVTQGATDVANQLNQQRAAYLWDVENANRQIAENQAARQVQAAELGMQYGQLPTQEAQSRLAGQQQAFNLATAEQQQRQAVIDSEMNKFAEKYRLTDPESLSALLALLGMTYTTSTGKSSQSGWDLNLYPSGGSFA